jgi:carbon-monoxide dehydrogenase large subunit
LSWSALISAARLGLDPAEIRLRNLIPKGAHPFTSASGFVYDSGDYPQGAPWPWSWPTMKGSRERRGPWNGRLLGVGVSCYTEYTGLGSLTYRRRGMAEVPGPETARVSLAADGTVRCRLSFSSQGQGHATTAAQIVADELGIALEHVVVSQPDTDETPAGSGTFASRGAIAQHGTAGAAAVTLRTKILDVAAGLLEASAADLVIHGGRVSVLGMPDRGVTLSDVAGAVGPARLEAIEHLAPPGPTLPGPVHVAPVGVDATWQGDRAPLRGGRRLRPRHQPHDRRRADPRAVAQGNGEALRRGARLRSQRAAPHGSLMDYPPPAAGDLAVVHPGPPRDAPTPLTPGGHKGMGEGGTIGAPAAIANAVADAVRPLGIEITALPIRPETLARITPTP